MKIMLVAISIAVPLGLVSPSFCQPRDVEAEVRAVNDRFVTAQDNRDLDSVRKTLSDREDFLWISEELMDTGRQEQLTRTPTVEDFAHKDVNSGAPAPNGRSSDRETR